MSLTVSDGCCQLPLCDYDNGIYTPFIRKFTRVCDPGGAVTTEINDFDLAPTYVEHYLKQS